MSWLYDVSHERTGANLSLPGNVCSQNCILSAEESLPSLSCPKTVINTSLVFSSGRHSGALRLVVPAGLVCPNLVPTAVEPWLCVPEQESSPAAKIEEE